RAKALPFGAQASSFFSFAGGKVRTCLKSLGSCRFSLSGASERTFRRNWLQCCESYQQSAKGEPAREAMRMGGPRCRRGMLGVLAWVTLLGVALFWGRWPVEAATPPNVLVIGLSGDVDNLDPAVTMTGTPYSSRPPSASWACGCGRREPRGGPW